MIKRIMVYCINNALLARYLRFLNRVTANTHTKQYKLYLHPDYGKSLWYMCGRAKVTLCLNSTQRCQTISSSWLSTSPCRSVRTPRLTVSGSILIFRVSIFQLPSRHAQRTGQAARPWSSVWRHGFHPAHPRAAIELGAPRQTKGGRRKP